MPDFRISPEAAAQLDLIARAMGRDRNYILNEALDNYVGLSSLVEKATASPRENGLIDDADAGAMVGSWRPAKASEELSFQATHADMDEALRPKHESTYTFLDPPVPPREMEKTEIGAQFPILQ